MKDKRNYGIDFLRILSMLFVVILHCLGRGGVLNTVILNSSQYKLAWFLEIVAYCAVDIFALISGYVAYTGKEKNTDYSKYIVLWLQVVFYGLLVTLIFNIWHPELVTSKDYLFAVLPVTKGLYWYFTAYTGLFIIMPILNKVIYSCNPKTLRKMFIAIILGFSIYDTFAKNFVLSNGYSVIWIILLYLLGGIMKKCEIGKNVRVYQALIGIIICYILTYLYKMYGFQNEFFDINKGLLINYTSPTVLGAAMFYLIGFSKINFPKIIQKVIKFTAPATFAVYLLNNQRFIWNYVMNLRFTYLYNASILRLGFDVMRFSIIFVVIAILIDKVRIYLFKVCHINDFARIIANLLNKVVTKLSAWI
ncbi:MAG: acyltransferase [Bacilli bacterium]|nr:acyltransferase [Bacilli bacterium]